MPRLDNGKPVRGAVPTTVRLDGAHRKNSLAALLLLGLGAAALAVMIPHPGIGADTVSYAKQVQPIFDASCVACHSAGQLGAIASHLDLTSYAGLRAGSNRGLEIIPRHSDRSPMLKLLDDNWRSANSELLRMPPFGPKLSDEQLATLRNWIDQGAEDN